MSRCNPLAILPFLMLVSGCGALPHSRITPASAHAEILVVGLPPSAVVTVDGASMRCEPMREGCLFRFEETKRRHFLVRDGNAQLFEQDQFVAVGSRKVIFLPRNGGNKE